MHSHPSRIYAALHIRRALWLRKFFHAELVFYVTPPLCGEKAEVSMKSIMDLKNERKALWEQTKAFVDKNRDPKTGLVNAAAVEQYNRGN